MRRPLIVAAGAALAISVVLPTRETSAQDHVDRFGRDLFEAHCGLCHGKSGWATRVLARRVPPDQAPLEQRSNLTGPFVELVVRQGLGSMPQIRRAELDDATLRKIVTYLEDKR